MTFLESHAVSRNERNILRSRGQNYGDGSHEFDQDMFDVSEETCTGDGWGEVIDSWDIITHDLDDAECGKHKESMKCLCVAYFSLGAMLPPYRPKFLCESCNEWNKNAAPDSIKICKYNNL